MTRAPLRDDQPTPVRWRRPRPRFLWILVLALAVLLGRGLGLWGRAEAPREAGRAETQQSQTHAAQAKPIGTEPSTAPSTAPPDERPPAAPAAEVSGSEAAAGPDAPRQPPTAAARPAIDGDRFASLVSVIAARTADGQLGSALVALHDVRRLPLDAVQSTVLEATARELEAELAEACSRIVQGLRQGAVLRVRDEIEHLLADGAALAAPLVTAAVRVAGLEGDWFGRFGSHDGALPIPTPLPKMREVRVRWRETLQVGQVVDSRSDQLTLRIVQAGGQCFPTVPVEHCEPIDVSANEAIEMGFAALQAKDALLARLWLAVADLRAVGPAPERSARLRALLR